MSYLLWPPVIAEVPRLVTSIAIRLFAPVTLRTLSGIPCRNITLLAQRLESRSLLQPLATLLHMAPVRTLVFLVPGRTVLGNRPGQGQRGVRKLTILVLSIPVIIRTILRTLLRYRPAFETKWGRWRVTGAT